MNRAVFTNTVHTRTLCLLNNSSLQYRDLAIATGYKVGTIATFVRRDAWRLSLPVAVALCKAYPAVGEDLHCNYCGQWLTGEHSK